MNLLALLLAPQAVQAAEATAASGLSGLGLNPGLLIFQLINFGVVAVIIWFLLLKPLVEKMKERENLIEESLNKSQKIEETFNRLDVEAKLRLEETKRQAKQIIEQAKNEAASEAAKEKEKGRQEIELMLKETRTKIQEEKQVMFADLKKEVGSLVLLVAEKIFKEKMDTPEEKKLVEKILKDID